MSCVWVTLTPFIVKAVDSGPITRAVADMAEAQDQSGAHVKPG